MISTWDEEYLHDIDVYNNKIYGMGIYSSTAYIIDISDSINILKSALTDNNMEIPKGHYESQSMKDTVVPNRNAIFSSILVSWTGKMTGSLQQQKFS